MAEGSNSGFSGREQNVENRVPNRVQNCLQKGMQNDSKPPAGSALRLGIIGCGLRTLSLLKAMRTMEADFRICSITDINREKALERLHKDGFQSEGVRFYEDADEMLAKEVLDGVIVGTRCSLHTEMALKVIPTGIPLLLEKPVATDMADWQRLHDAQNDDPLVSDRVVVSFPLRFTPLLQEVKKRIASGQIGSVRHIQAVNNAPYGSVYYHNWYRDEQEAGGLFLQKATHDLDYINFVLGEKPIQLCAMTSKQYFKGSRPAGLKCCDCIEQETCVESPYNLKVLSHEAINGEYCCFATDTGNEDSGSVMVRYESGLHATYSQDFIVKKKAGSRGARFIGDKGTLEFDWMTSEIKIHMHYVNQEERIVVDPAGLPHYGGDVPLVRNFILMARGKEPSKANLKDGLLSTLMCLKARESAKTGTFQEL